MGYGQVAVGAVRIFKAQEQPDIFSAWHESRKLNNLSDEGCPRVGFLGLCEGNYINGVPKKRYIKTGRSVLKTKAISIRDIIMKAKPPALPTQTKASVWKQIGGNNHDHGLIDVVYALFNNNMLR